MEVHQRYRNPDQVDARFLPGLPQRADVEAVSPLLVQDLTSIAPLAAQTPQVVTVLDEKMLLSQGLRLHFPSPFPDVDET